MFRFEYDRVIAYHPYRTHQPWDHGGVRLFQVDGVNGFQEEAELVRGMLRTLERRLIQDAQDEGLGGVCKDNHYGFTVVSEGPRPTDPVVTYQLRFSDGSLYVWLMPETWTARVEELERAHSAMGLRLEEAEREVMRLRQGVPAPIDYHSGAADPGTVPQGPCNDGEEHVMAEGGFHCDYCGCPL